MVKHDLHPRFCVETAKQFTERNTQAKFLNPAGDSRSGTAVVSTCNLKNACWKQINHFASTGVRKSLVGVIDEFGWVLSHDLS